MCRWGLSKGKELLGQGFRIWGEGLGFALEGAEALVLVEESSEYAGTRKVFESQGALYSSFPPTLLNDNSLQGYTQQEGPPPKRASNFAEKGSPPAHA